MITINKTIIVFLDIDGVLNNVGFVNSLSSKEYYKKVYDWRDTYDIGFLYSKNIREFVKAINELDTKYNVELVLSSTWRGGGTPVIDKLNRILVDHGSNVAITRVTGYIDSMHRGTEVDDYLKSNEYDSYIIIDDDNDFFDSQRPHFYRCDSQVGFVYEEFIQVFNNLKW